MQQLSAKVIVLRRINYGEADRIITVLSKERGKLTLIAKGVRKSTSKLAGGIELFSESDIQYIKGKGEMHTLASTRISTNYGAIVNSLESSNAAFEILAATDKVTEHTDDLRYYDLLSSCLAAINSGLSPKLIIGYFYVNLLNMTGHTIDISGDVEGNSFNETFGYQYNFDRGGFERDNYGYRSSVIKLIKLMSMLKPGPLGKITGAELELEESVRLLRRMVEYYLQIKPVGSK